MHKKHMFLRVFSKITTFACVFCTLSAWAETTTCDINYTPVTGNSIQNGNPTPENPVTIESVGTKVGNKYQIPVFAQGKNLYNPATRTDGYYIAASGGINSNVNFAYSDLIPAQAGVTYVMSGINGYSASSRRLHAYNANGNWIQQVAYIDIVRGAATGNQYVVSGTTPANTAFIRISYAKADTNIQVEQGSTATPIYLNAPLRKVGDYADVLDYKNGTITRNVGVKVLDGTENWNIIPTAYTDGTHRIYTNDFGYNQNANGISTHFVEAPLADRDLPTGQQGKMYHSGASFHLRATQFTSLPVAKQWLADQYANGTPVTVYYPLATPVVEQIENWSCTPPITEIKIATTKFVDEEFAAAEANLAATVQTIESVVSRTIAQTGQIQILQDTKQTRPDESCPANMKCLLVQDEDGTPHWYPIIEP